MTSIGYIDVNITINVISQSRQGWLMTLMRFISVGITLPMFWKEVVQLVFSVENSLIVLMKWEYLVIPRRINLEVLEGD
jgi:hypothetical protein